MNFAQVSKPDVRHDHVVVIVLIAHYFSSTRLLLAALMIHILLLIIIFSHLSVVTINTRQVLLVKVQFSLVHSLQALP